MYNEVQNGIRENVRAKVFMILPALSEFQSIFKNLINTTARIEVIT